MNTLVSKIHSADAPSRALATQTLKNTYATQVPVCALSPTSPAIVIASWRDVDIFGVRLDLPRSDVDNLESFLSEQERRNAKRFALERDRRRFIVARARLRELLGERLGTAAAEIEFSHGPHGKPALAQPFAGTKLRFNLSHSCELAVYGFAVDHEVGVDVEAVRPLPDADDIAAIFFSTAEYQAYCRLDAVDRTAGFFNCWTRKEAFIKAIGEGLHCPLKTFDVTLDPGESARLIRVDRPGCANTDWEMQSFSPCPGYVAALVVERDDRQPGRASVARGEGAAGNRQRRVAANALV